MKFYRVAAWRGHQGYGRHVPITFYIAANSALEASEKAQAMSGVKHTRPVISCVPISFSEYCEGKKCSAYYAHEKRIYGER